MLLVAAVGNTNVALGLFEDRDLRHAWRLPVQDVNWGDSWPKGPAASCTARIDAIAAAGVHPAGLACFLDWAESFFHLTPLVAGRDLTIPLENRCSPPESVGVDRLLNAFAAHQLCSGDLIVVDFGTAISFSAVSKDGAFLGGAIAPGLKMSARALHQQTARLPEVLPVPASRVTGASTEAAIQSALTWGLPGLVDRLLEGLLAERPGPTRVLGTGGDLEWFLRRSRQPIEAHPNLTLEGLRLLSDAHGVAAR
ncbi:MAG: type III pantothenate kinase [Planctomycetes bacterium]|nr:type III pantothenate kinase [Planctomycetota bacterium]